jgi:pilus assembly protein CpaE
MKLKVLLFASNETSSRLHSLLHAEEIDVVGSVQDENTVLDEISRSHPDIILVATDNMNIVLRACQQIYLLRPRSIPVVLSDENDPGLLHKIMQTGIHYVLPLSIDSDSLTDQLQGIYTNESARIMAMENTSSSTRKSQLIMVFGTQGGIGKTALAANLAVKLAQKKRKVVLLDYDLQFGDLNIFLGIDTKDTISDLLQEQSNPYADTIRRYLSLHASGVNLLCSPHSPEYAEGISAMQTERIVAALRTYYDYVIVDSSPVFSDINLSCIDASSAILFVTGMDIAALRNSKKGLTVLESLADKEKIKLVIGKEYAGNIKPADVARALEKPVWFSIPFDQKTMVDALNQGIPVVLDAPGSGLSKAFSSIAGQLDNGPEAEAGTKKKKAIPKGLFQKR